MATYTDIPPSTGAVVAVTTSTATPTIAMPSGAALKITLGIDVTKLIVTGLDLAADGGYNFFGKIIADGVHSVSCSLNDSDATGIIRGFFVGPTAASPNLLFLIDSVAQHGEFIASIRDTGTGNGKAWQTNFSTNVVQWYFGNSTLTANVTSFSLPNMLAGSVLNVRRI